jgi:hypothetical protein
VVEAHVAKGSEDLLGHADCGRPHLGPVGSSVGVSEAPTTLCRASDDERALVRGSVVGAAQHHHLGGLVPVALSARDDVVQVEESMIAAARHHTSRVVATHALLGA